MSLNFQCPICKNAIVVDDAAAGQTIKCPICGNAVAVPPVVAAAPVNAGTQSSSLPTVSLVLGILSFIMVPFCGLASLVTGIIALVKISGSKGLIPGKGKAIAGILFGIWSFFRFPLLILLAMLLPLGKAREKARTITCSSNLKQIGLAVVMFADDHNDRIPNSVEECREYIGTELKCPECECGYEFLPEVKGRNLNRIQSPSTTPVAVCGKHSSGSIVLYADGHVGYGEK